MFRVLLACVWLAIPVSLFGWQEPTVPSAMTLRLPVNRDTWFSSVDNERLGSNGGAARMKLKSYQEMSLVDFDAQGLKGKLIGEAKLHLNVVDKKRLLRLTTSSFSAPWVEGDATSYAQVAGVSAFQFQQFPDKPWAYPGSDLTAVILGSGNSWWQSSEPTQIDDKGWQEVEVSQDVIAARVAGLSHGVLIFDDVGSEWTRTGDKFDVFPFPNRYIYSRQQNASVAPYFTVQIVGEDSQAPLPPEQLKIEHAGLKEGEAKVKWLTPLDRGAAGTLGFLVAIDGNDVPLYLVPKAGEANSQVEMHIRDLNLDAGKTHLVSIRAVDRAGNVSESLQGELALSQQKTWQPKRDWKKYRQDSLVTYRRESSAWPNLGSTEFAIIDELDKVNAVTGKLAFQEDASYWTSNHLWNAAAESLQLCGAKKEWLAFQVVVRGDSASRFSAQLKFKNKDLNIPLELGRYVPVTASAGAYGDPIVPLSRWPAIATLNQAKVKTSSFHLEFHVPSSLEAGQHDAELVLTLGTESKALKVQLEVWDFEIPDRLSFFPEMNCYGLPENERDYYRLAYRHRTVLNRLPYYHNGRVADGCAPEIQGDQFDWSRWDARFEPLFTGKAFADLERGGVPIECFYLPMFENWPIPIEPNYRESYWADEALSPKYREQFVKASANIAAHIREKKWSTTIFQFYLNGKNNFKERGWSRATSPWILDEPSHYQDFDALRWFGTAFKEGVMPQPASNIVFRTDVSRPEWQREVLDGLVGYAVVSSAVRRYPRHVLDRAQRNRELVVEYGTTNRVDQANVQPEAWCVEAWAMGINGVLPWQTIGTAESWKNGDELALFYPDPQSKNDAPIPSVRLKAYRRGEQDVEYLELVRRKLNVPQWAVGDWLNSAIQWNSSREGTGAQGGEDAGRVKYGALTPQEFHLLRRFLALELAGSSSR
jgi:hypothetical protein